MSDDTGRTEDNYLVTLKILWVEGHCEENSIMLSCTEFHSGNSLPGKRRTKAYYIDMYIVTYKGKW